MTVVEKAAYLKGLVDGTLQDKPEHRLWTVLCELVSDMAHELEDLQETTLEHAEALDDISDELSSLEETVWDMDFDTSLLEDDEDLTDAERAFLDSLSDPEENGKLIHLPDRAELYDEEEFDDLEDGEEDAEPDEDSEELLSDSEEELTESDDDPEDDPEEDDGPDEILYDITCPVCGKEITLDEETLASGTMNCPHCGEILEFDVSDDEE